MQNPRFSQCRLSLRLLVLLCGPLLSTAVGGELPADFQFLAGGHAGAVTDAAYSPDGQVVASASEDSTIKLWSTNGVLLRTLNVHPCQATAMAFSPDGTKLAVGTYHGPTFNGGAGNVVVWQSTSGWQSTNIPVLRVTTHHLGRVNALAFSADSTRLASGGAEGSNVVQRVSDGTVLQRWAAYNTTIGPAAVRSLAFSSGGLLASGCEDNTLRVWNSSGSQIWNDVAAHASDVTAVAFSPDGSTLASGSLDQTIKLRDTGSWTVIRTLTGHTEGVCAVAFSPTGTSLGSGSLDNTARCWNVATGGNLATLTGHSDAITTLSFAPDGNTLATGSRDHTVKIWSLATESVVRDLCAQTDGVHGVACAPDGQTLATVANDRKILLRRLSDGALLRTLAGHTHWVSAIAFSPDGQTLASAGDPDGGSLKLWRVDDGTLQHTLAAGSNGATTVAFAHDGSLLASGGDATDQTIQLWDPTNGLPVRTLAGHTHGVTALAFSPSGGTIASGGRRFDNTVKLWDLATGDLVQTYSGVSNNVECIAFAPDGNTIAAAGSGDGVIQLWEVSTGAGLTLGSGANPVFGVAFSPDGGTLASSGDGRITFWNVAAGTVSQVWTQEASRVSCFAYSPNGNLFAYGRDDATTVATANPWSVLGQPALTFSDMDVQGDGTRMLQAACQPTVRYLIQTSENLQDWDYLTTAKSATHTLQVMDSTTGTASQRFYRAVTPP